MRVNEFASISEEWVLMELRRPFPILLKSRGEQVKLSGELLKKVRSKLFAYTTNSRRFTAPWLRKQQQHTYVQDWTQVSFSKYFIFGRVIWNIHITSYLTELCVF